VQPGKFSPRAVRLETTAGGAPAAAQEPATP